ncbi:NADH dehydrogenase [ubiquinone] 1 alpha subcomplex subunit 5 [Biomphalaria glabrata]|nr:NADH dehydrogenase [ubiquinone] 1 alpha subcomplex subunit 5-like [Biomphalaria glabrata]
MHISLVTKWLLIGFSEPKEPGSTPKVMVNIFELHKLTTGLTGLPVARHPLKVLYSRILEYINKMPFDAGYRKHTEQITNQRLNLVHSETDVQKLKEKINRSQIEEVIKQAEREP